MWRLNLALWQWFLIRSNFAPQETCENVWRLFGHQSWEDATGILWVETRYPTMCRAVPFSPFQRRVKNCLSPNVNRAEIKKPCSVGRQWDYLVRSTDVGPGQVWVWNLSLVTASPVPQFLHLRNEDGNNACFTERINEVVPVMHVAQCLAQAGLNERAVIFIALFAFSLNATHFNWHEKAI